MITFDAPPVSPTSSITRGGPAAGACGVASADADADGAPAVAVAAGVDLETDVTGADVGWVDDGSGVANVVDEVDTATGEMAVDRTADRSLPHAPITAVASTAITPTRIPAALPTSHDTATPLEPVRRPDLQPRRRR